MLANALDSCAVTTPLRALAFGSILAIGPVTASAPQTVLPSTPAQAPATDTTREESLAPGVVHVEMRRSASGVVSGTWVIHVLRLERKRADLRVGQALDEVVGAETVRSLAERHGALAAINGGYFRTTGSYRGEPIGAFVLGGRLLSEPDRKRPVLALGGGGDRTRVGFARLVVEPVLRIDKAAPLAVSGLNRPRGRDDVVVYTPEFHGTTLTDRAGFEATVSRGRVVVTREGSGSSAIPRDGYVVAAAGAGAVRARALLRQGARVRLEAPLRVEPPLDFAAETLLGGGPWLLHAGAPAPLAEGEPYAEGFMRQRHPRTAVGRRADGAILLVTVDGRQPGWSDGMTIAELTDLMKDLGCPDALNLDGGGSTTMVVRGQVVNRPSDATGERPVSDALLVFPR